VYDISNKQKKKHTQKINNPVSVRVNDIVFLKDDLETGKGGAIAAW